VIAAERRLKRALRLSADVILRYKGLNEFITLFASRIYCEFPSAGARLTGSDHDSICGARASAT
jgi:hypothetical protein